MENKIEQMLLDEFITLYLIRPVLNVLMTKCSFIMAAGGAAKDKVVRYVQGSEYKKVDAWRSMRSEHINMERWKRQEAQPLLTHRIARRALRNEENPI
jgi:hypothetical protein